MKAKFIPLVILQLSLLLFAGGEEKSSSPARRGANPDFYEAQKKLDQGGNFYFFMDTKDLLKNFIGETRDSIATSGKEKGQTFFIIVDRILSALGIYDIQYLGISVVEQGNSRLMKTYLKTPPEKRGLFKVLGGEPHAFETLSYAPADSSFFLSCDVDPVEALALVRATILESGGPTALASFNTSMTNATTKTGFAIEEALNCLGGEFFIAGYFDRKEMMTLTKKQAVTESLPTPRAAIGVRVRDARLLNMLKEFLTRTGIATKEESAGGITRLFIQPKPDMDPSIKPAFFYDGRFILFSTSSEYLERILATKKGTANLGSNEEYMQIVKALPIKGNELLYIGGDFPVELKNYTHIWKEKLIEAASASDGRVRNQPIIRLSRLLERPGARGALAAMRVNEPEGILIVCNTTNNIIEGSLIAACSPIVFPILAFKSQEVMKTGVRSKVNSLRANMRSVATALESYYVDWSSYPPTSDFDSLTRDGAGGIYNIYALKRLTTPIAYITSVPIDPFAELEGTPLLYFGPQEKRDAELSIKGFLWCIWSVGPDGRSDIRSKEDLANLETNILAYDPTNGLLSAGDIACWNSPGGIKVGAVKVFP
ncbi:MAG: hypothetical protein NT106_10250 [Candidatus Sumerlaeota bacterium]|nr:hypothetical protein [Candidatus Sumerlaeota bacterium]